MNRKTVSGIILTLLLVSMSTLAFNIQPAKTEPATIIVPDDYERIQWAIGNASEGDTVFVRADIYYEHLTIDKSISLIGENEYSTIVDGNKTSDVVSVTASNITISGFTIQNGWNGIVLNNSSGNVISNNIINSNVEDGVYLNYSDYNVIKDNSLSRNKLSPYVVFLCKGNIHLFHSNHNNISKNELTFASQGIEEGIGSGILLEFSALNRIAYNEATFNAHAGIYIRNFGGGSDDYNVLVGNNASFNNATGIELLKSHRNMIWNNTASSNNASGLLLWGSQENTVLCNVLDSNAGDGVDVWDVGGNKITDNSITNNRDGVRLVWSNYNTIIENLLSHNDCGIRTRYDTYDNLVYHNNFVSNGIQAYCMEQQQRSWDDGYPSGGNYWSDQYHGDCADHYSGLNQDIPGSDGIVDTPYFIDADNQDNYPLMEPWSGVPATVPATVEIYPETLSLHSFGRWIKAYIELPEGYDVSDIEISTVTLNNDVPAELHPTKVGDYDNDGIPDLMVKFSRIEAMRSIFRIGENTLRIRGEINELIFEGRVTIRVNNPH